VRAGKMPNSFHHLQEACNKKRCNTTVHSALSASITFTVRKLSLAENAEDAERCALAEYLTALPCRKLTIKKRCNTTVHSAFSALSASQLLLHRFVANKKALQHRFIRRFQRFPRA
jgi:hypothetical protein